MSLSGVTFADCTFSCENMLLVPTAEKIVLFVVNATDKCPGYAEDAIITIVRTTKAVDTISGTASILKKLILIADWC